MIARSSKLVEVAPEQLDGSSLALWAHMISEGEVAIEMDLDLVSDSQRRSQSRQSERLSSALMSHAGVAVVEAARSGGSYRRVAARRV